MQNQESPLITVIIPVYNTEKYLSECVESVLHQTFTDFECILVDDGSTDASPQICDAFASTDSRIHVFHSQNKGVSAARNIGIDNAKGKYMTLLDSDDYFLPNALEILYKQSELNEADLYLANTIKLRNGKQTLFLNDKDSLFSADEKIKVVGIGGYLFKLDIIKHNNIRFIEGLAYSEDKVFLYEYDSAIRAVKYLAEPVYVYRIHESSACRKKNEVKKASHQLWAASCLRSLSERLKVNRPILAKTLQEEFLFQRRISFYIFGRLNMSYGDFCEFKRVYHKFFGQSWLKICDFYYLLTSQFLKYRKELLYSSLYRIFVEKKR